MDILEISVIGSSANEKEKLFTVLSDQQLRKFEGVDVGYLELDKDTAMYMYFLNQEADDYFYLWDLIIPQAIGTVLLCDLGNSEIFSKNVERIEHLEKRYSTPLHICSLPVDGQKPAALKADSFGSDSDRDFLYFDPGDRKSAKEVLLKVLAAAD